MKGFSRPWMGLACLILATLSTGCSKGNDSHGEVSFSVRRAPAPHARVFAEPISMLAAPSGWGLPAPTASADFDCFGVFVRYPEQADSAYCEDVNGSVVVRPHQTVGLVPVNTQARAQVRIGAGRQFYVFGFDASLGFCPQAHEDLSSYKSSLSAPYILGSTTQDVGQGSTVVSINAAFTGSTVFEKCTFPANSWNPPAFNPCTNVGGCSVWFDASDSATLFSDDGCTSAASPAGTVGCLADKSGNGYHATNATAADRPIYTASAQNGLSMLDFDGTTDSLSIGGFLASSLNTPGTTVFVVFILDATGSSIFGAQDAVSRKLSFYSTASVPTDGFGMEFTSGNANSGGGEATTGAVHMLALYGTPGGASSTFHIDGNATPAGSYSPTDPGLPNVLLNLGAYNNNGTPSSNMDGRIGEFLIFNSELSITNINAVTNYLKAKWNIP